MAETESESDSHPEMPATLVMMMEMMRMMMSWPQLWCHVCQGAWHVTGREMATALQENIT